MFKYFLIICFIVEVFLIGYKIGAIQCDNKNPVNSADANEENRNVKTKAMIYYFNPNTGK